MELLITNSYWSKTSSIFRSPLLWRSVTSWRSSYLLILFYTRLARLGRRVRDIKHRMMDLLCAEKAYLQCIPGRYESCWKELEQVKQFWRNRKELKVEDYGIAALLGLECFAWYCAGEIVGRGFTITGYKV